MAKCNAFIEIIMNGNKTLMAVGTPNMHKEQAIPPSHLHILIVIVHNKINTFLF